MLLPDSFLQTILLTHCSKYKGFVIVLLTFLLVYGDFPLLFLLQYQEKNIHHILRSASFFSFGSKRKDKLVHKGFRIEEDVIRALTDEAGKKGISVSSLVNRTLKNYVTHEMHFEELGFLLVSKDFLRKVFNVIEDKNLIEDFGKDMGSTIAKEYISYFYPQVNSKTLVDFLHLWFRRFQSFRHNVDTDAKHSSNQGGDRSPTEMHYFMVNHDINMKFSLALKAILQGLIEPVIKGTVEFKEITPSSISFSFQALVK
jgi:hypothetical protein